MLIKKEIKTIIFIIITVNLSSCEWKTTKKDSTNNVVQTDSVKITKKPKLSLNKSSDNKSSDINSRRESENNIKYNDIKNGDTIFFDKEDGYDQLYQAYYNANSIKGKMRNGINEKYPYGPKEIINKSFSSFYLQNLKKDYYDTTKFINDIYNICFFYFKNIDDSLTAYWGGDNLGEGALCFPEIKSAQYLSFDEYEDTYFNYSGYCSKPIDHLENILGEFLIYRFPNIQNNEIYFTSTGPNVGSYSHLPFYSNDKFDGYLSRIESIYGNLIIVNKNIQHATIIPVLSFEAHNYDVDFRFFVINKDKNILIYKMESERLKDRSTGKFRHKYNIWIRKTDVISINNDNKIEIDKINNNDKH